MKDRSDWEIECQRFNMMVDLALAKINDIAGTVITGSHELSNHLSQAMVGVEKETEVELVVVNPETYKIIRDNGQTFFDPATDYANLAEKACFGVLFGRTELAVRTACPEGMILAVGWKDAQTEPGRVTRGHIVISKVEAAENTR